MGRGSAWRCLTAKTAIRAAGKAKRAAGWRLNPYTPRPQIAAGVGRSQAVDLRPRIRRPRRSRLRPSWRRRRPCMFGQLYRYRSFIFDGRLPSKLTGSNKPGPAIRLFDLSVPQRSLNVQPGGRRSGDQFNTRSTGIRPTADVHGDAIASTQPTTAPAETTAAPDPSTTPQSCRPQRIGGAKAIRRDASGGRRRRKPARSPPRPPDTRPATSTPASTRSSCHTG